MVEIKTVTTQDEVEQVAHLTAQVFPKKGEYNKVYRFLKYAYQECPYMIKEHCWIAKDRDKVLAKLQIVDFLMQIDDVSIKTGWVNALFVVPEHWGKGYPDLLILEAYATMEKEEYDLSLGYGIRDYYRHWKVTPIMPAYDLILDAKKIPKCQRRTMASLQNSDVEQLLRIYHQSNIGRTGIIVRSPTLWNWMPGKPENILIKKNGYLGYRFKSDFLELQEIGAEDISFYEDALRELSFLAQEKGISRILATIPPDHPFSHAAIHYGAIVKIEYKTMQGCLGRIIHFPSLMKKLAPVLEKRWKDSCFLDVEIHLQFRSEESECSLVLNQGGKRIADLSIHLFLASFTQMVFGYKSVEQILAEQGVYLDKTPLQMLQILFPNGYPFTWLADRV